MTATIDTPALLPGDLEEIGSPGELMPKGEREPILASVITCRYCPESWPLAPQNYFKRGTHEKAAHREQWAAAKSEPPAKRVRGTAAKKAQGPVKKATPPRPKPPPPTRREKADELVGQLAGLVGSTLHRTGISPAGGLCVAYCSSVYGRVADEYLVRSRVDKWVQPVAKAYNKSSSVVSVVTLPLFCIAVERAADPVARFEQLYPMIRSAMIDVSIEALPGLRAEVKKEQRVMAELAEVAELQAQLAAMRLPDPETGIVNDPIEATIRAIFGPLFEADAT